MTYGSADGANGLVQTWDGSATPTAAQVGVWLAEAYAIINRAIGTAGYTAPVTDTAIAAYAELEGLGNLYAAAYILRAVSIDTASGEGEERSEVWLKDFWARLRDLTASNLALIGIVPLPDTITSRRGRIRTLQMRKVDGYSAYATGEASE